MHPLCERLSMSVPVIQAPMAGTSTAALAAAVSKAGGLGSIALGAMNATDGESAIRDVRRLTDRPFNVNLFCHTPARRRPAVEDAWRTTLAEKFKVFGAEPPSTLREIYTSFVADDAMLQMLIRQRPAVVSFHFGLPSTESLRALRSTNAILLATATNLAEAEAAAAAGIDAVVAQGYEAGGHRGTFDPDARDARLGTRALVQLLVRKQSLPVIAAGGIMDGVGIAAALSLGAAAAQLGTAFIACPESSADVGYRAALGSDAAFHTIITRVISGRPARCLMNEIAGWGENVADADVPDYPIAYDAAKSLNAAAKAKGNFGFGAQWAGQGAPLSRPMPVAELMETLTREWRKATS